MLHADADFSVAVERSIEAHNVRGVALVQHLQLPNDLVPNGRFDLQVDQLEHSGHWFDCSRITWNRNNNDRTFNFCRASYAMVKHISILISISWTLYSLIHISCSQKYSAYLPRHNQTRGSVGDLEDDSSVAGTQLADLLKVIVLELAHLLLLCQKGLQTFPLLLVQLELFQLLLQSL